MRNGLLQIQNNSLPVILRVAKELNKKILRYGNTSWDGTTRTIWGSDNYYTKAYVTLNRYWTDTYIANNNQLRLNLVTTHEIGHALGLKHAIYGFPIMFGADVWIAYLENNSLANGPTTDDINGINSIY